MLFEIGENDLAKLKIDGRCCLVEILSGSACLLQRMKGWKAAIEGINSL